jgi:hypothetical protein
MPTGGVMKNFQYVIAASAVFLLAGASVVHCQDDYTFIGTNRGPQICIGTWVPPSTVGLAGTCQGEMIGLPQLTALSTRQTVDRLDQLIDVLSGIDQKLDTNNARLDQLIEATLSTQKAIDDQVRQTSDFMKETISERFDALPKEILENDTFKDELTKLKEELLSDIEKRYPPKKTPPPSK